MTHITTDSRNPFAPPLSDKKWKSISKHKFLWTSITYLGTHHAHTLLYPSCTWTMLGTVFTNHSTAMDKSQNVSCWFSKTSSSTWAVFTFSWSAGLKGVIFIMDANPLLNSLHPLPKWCGLSTSPNNSNDWQWTSWVAVFCLYALCHTTKFSVGQSFHYLYQSTWTYPLNSMINCLLHHLLHVTFITASTSYHKIKGLLNKNYSLGNFTSGFIKCRVSSTSWELVASQEGLWSVEYVSKWLIKMNMPVLLFSSTRLICFSWWSNNTMHGTGVDRRLSGGTCDNQLLCLLLHILVHLIKYCMNASFSWSNFRHLSMKWLAPKSSAIWRPFFRDLIVSCSKILLSLLSSISIMEFQDISLLQIWKSFSWTFMG